MGDLPTATKPGIGSRVWSEAQLAGQTLGGFFGGSVGSTLGGMAGQAAADYFSPQARALRQQSQKDIAALKEGKLGFSEAEKSGMLARTLRGLRAGAKGAEGYLRRLAAAAGGFGRSGAQTRALGQLASERGEQLAQRAGQIDALSQETAQERFKDIMGRLSKKREEQMERLGGAAQALAKTPAAYGVASQAVQKAEEERLKKFAADKEKEQSAAAAAQASRVAGE